MTDSRSARRGATSVGRASESVELVDEKHRDLPIRRRVLCDPDAIGTLRHRARHVETASMDRDQWTPMILGSPVGFA